MNTKQLTYPTIQEQQKYWIDKEAVSNNATPETCDEQFQKLVKERNHRDIGGNELPDRIEANEDFYEVERNDFDRGDLRYEGRNPDGSGESYAARNV